MSWQDTIIAAHTAVTNAVSRYERLKSDRYFVWMEEGATDLLSDGRHAERAVRGTTDLYTKQDDDPWAAALEQSFDAYGVAWYLNSVQYEEETGFVHTEWVWEVPAFRDPEPEPDPEPDPEPEPEPEPDPEPEPEPEEGAGD